MTGYSSEYCHMSANGGTAGKGGTILASENSKIYAFNGNLYTDGTDYNNGINQCPFYSQAGIKIATYSYYDKSNSGRFSIKLLENQSTIAVTNYENKLYLSEPIFSQNKTLNINTTLGITGNPLSNVDMSKQGIGSGAGYTEISNGTYTIDASLN